jgi:hypothetical protein
MISFASDSEIPSKRLAYTTYLREQLSGVLAGGHTYAVIVGRELDVLNIFLYIINTATSTGYLGN